MGSAKALIVVVALASLSGASALKCMTNNGNDVSVLPTNTSVSIECAPRHQCGSLFFSVQPLHRPQPSTQQHEGNDARCRRSVFHSMGGWSLRGTKGKGAVCRVPRGRALEYPFSGDQAIIEACRTWDLLAVQYEPHRH